MAALQAEPRGSASYSLTSETFDAAGGAANGNTCASVSSLGGITGTATAAAVTETAKQGFIAQLCEVSGLYLTSSSSLVNEGDSLQLASWETLDDDTLGTLAASAVAWSVASGPATVSSAGLVTANPVYQDTTANVNGTYLGFTSGLPLTVVNTASDNFGTYAGDDLSDDWQVQYFGLANPNAAPDRDPDHDGSGNAFEYAAGLIPTSAASRFSLEVQAVPGQPSQKRILFSPRYENSTYTVATSADLTHWSPLTNFTTSDSGTQRTVTDTAATTARRFYRVTVAKP
jgi:hypothetical protein